MRTTWSVIPFSVPLSFFIMASFRKHKPTSPSSSSAASLSPHRPSPVDPVPQSPSPYSPFLATPNVQRPMSTFGFPEDPQQRAQHLSTLGFQSSPKLTYQHLKSTIVAALALFSLQYHLTTLNIALFLLSVLYYPAQITQPWIDFSVKTSLLVGLMLGQVLFGWLADRVGRRVIFIAELSLVIIGVLASCFASYAIRGISVFGMLAFWQFLIGLGLGGDVTIAGVVASEFAHTQRRGHFLAAVFTAQGIGMIFACGLAALILACFGPSIHNDPFMLDYVWRIQFGIALVPTLASLILRLSLPETPRYLHAQHLQGHSRGLARASFPDFMHYFRPFYRQKIVIGVCLAWFGADFVYFGTQLNYSTILNMLGIGAATDPFQYVMRNILGQLMSALLGTLPGYIVTLFLVDRIGRRGVQFIGFGCNAAIYLSLAIAYYSLLFYAIPAFITLYVLSQFFLAMVSVTSYMIPAEVFPTQHRSTAFGLAATSGKLGALLAQGLVFFILNSELFDGTYYYLDKLIYAFFAMMILGILGTVLLKETANKSLEELGEEMDAPPPEPVVIVKPVKVFET